MAKLSRKDLIQLEPGPGGQPAAAGPDILTRINETINNFKGLLEMAKAQGQSQAQNVLGRGQDRGASNIPASIIIDLVVKKYGNTTIEEVIKNLSPMTIKQLAEMLKNAGLIK